MGPILEELVLQAEPQEDEDEEPLHRQASCVAHELHREEVLVMSSVQGCVPGRG